MAGVQPTEQLPTTPWKAVEVTAVEMQPVSRFRPPLGYQETPQMETVQGKLLQVSMVM